MWNLSVIHKAARPSSSVMEPLRWALTNLSKLLTEPPCAAPPVSLLQSLLKLTCVGMQLANEPNVQYVFN